MNQHNKLCSEIIALIRHLDSSLPGIFESSIGISPTRYEIMQALLHTNHVTQVYLQNMLDIDRAAITRHLKILEDKGYVLKERNGANHREMVVSVTDQGRTVMTEGLFEHRKFVEKLLKGITQQDLTHLSTTLNQLKNNITELKQENTINNTI